MMYQLMINGVDYIDQLKAYTLNISKDLKEYQLKFSLQLTTDQVANIEVGQEAFFKQDGTIVSGGIIYEIGYSHIMRKLIVVEITCETFKLLAQRKVIKPLVINDYATLLNKAEEYVMTIFENYLQPYGVELGLIQSNLKIADGVVEEDIEEETVQAKLDDIAKKTNTEWYISYDKKFYFFKGMANPVSHATVLSVDSPTTEFMDVTVTRKLEDYRNHQIIIGGEAPAGTPTEYIDGDTGALRYEEADLTEIDRIKLLIGYDGIYMKKETTDKVTNVDELKKYYAQQKDKFGQPQFELGFQTYNPAYNPGDYITVDIPFFNIHNQQFVIESIDIQEVDNDVARFAYDIKANSRKTNDPNEDLYDYLRNKNSNAVSVGKEKNNSFAEQIDIQIQTAVSTSATIEFV